MDNSHAANRRLALRVVLTQIIVAVVVGLAFLIQSLPSAIGALASGLLMAAGSAILALRVFAPALAAPGATLARFAVGSLIKWIVVIAGLYLVVVVWRLPAMPAVAALIATALVNLMMLKAQH